MKVNTYLINKDNKNIRYINISTNRKQIIVNNKNY